MAGSLAVALIYNGLQIEHATRAIDAQKRATELRLFTRLHTLLNESGSKFPFYEKELDDVIKGRRRKLSRQGRYIFNNTLNHCEYLAWLLNNRFITLAQARDLWLDPMTLFYSYSAKIYGREDTEKSHPELTKLLRHFGRIK